MAAAALACMLAIISRGEHRTSRVHDRNRGRAKGTAARRLHCQQVILNNIKQHMLFTRDAIDVGAAEVSDKDAVDPAMHDLRLLQQLPLGVFSTLKEHHCFLSSDSDAVWTPA